jgi:hypothetical protein
MPRISGFDLINEGQRLARASFHLVRNPGAGQQAALWSGHGPGEAPAAYPRHWLTINSRYLPPAVRQRGSISIYTAQHTITEGLVVSREGERLPASAPGSTPLFAKQVRSYPPIDAIFQYGSALIQGWLADNDWLPPQGQWGPEHAYNETFPDQAVVQEYEQFIQKRHPLFTGGAVAVLGGWHIPWSAGDWHDRLGESLIGWTLEDAEPWLEIWWSAEKGFHIIPRSA